MAKKPAPLTSDLLVRKGEATPSSVDPAARSTDAGLTAGGHPQTPEPEIVLAADESTDAPHGGRRRLAAVLGLVAIVTASVLAVSMYGADDTTLSVAPVGTETSAGDEIAAPQAPSIAPLTAPSGPLSVGTPTAPAHPDLRLSPGEATRSAGRDPATAVTVAAAPDVPVEPGPDEPSVVETVPPVPAREAATITPPQTVLPVEEIAAEVGPDTTRQALASTLAVPGQYLVQVLSVRSESAARAAWGRMQTSHTALLGSETLNLERADLGERGTYFRVRFGAFNARGDANAVCSTLKERGQDCLVKRVN